MPGGVTEARWGGSPVEDTHLIPGLCFVMNPANGEVSADTRARHLNITCKLGGAREPSSEYFASNLT